MFVATSMGLDTHGDGRFHRILPLRPCRVHPIPLETHLFSRYLERASSCKFGAEMGDPPPLHRSYPQFSAILEAQQRYNSYRAIPGAIVSQNFFVLVFMGYRTIIARYVAKWGIARMCLCKIKYQRGVSHHSGGVLTSLKKYRAIWGIAAIVSQYRAIWGH